ncbi:hypothetical protein BGZ65_009777 [Modicella reniformis]|uniref:Uncharacterized protein n=1 Tax=Modicella reniformis TaxID=1440133 RepID=A0A9P6ME85_9FUNG|nr:hypothetical protein BGZ65_009777 [Modicella reniformis]
MRYTSPVLVLLLHWSIAVTRAAPVSLDTIDLSTKDAYARRNILPDGPSISLNKRAIGTFSYETIRGELVYIKDPEDGKCYIAGDGIIGAGNGTDREAVFYHDFNCKIVGDGGLLPGEAGDLVDDFFSFKFVPAPA